MYRRQLFPLATLILLITAVPSLWPGSLASATTLPAEDAPLIADDALLEWRFIGLRTDLSMPCPEPEIPAGGDPWETRLLFESTGSLPNALEPFCLYERPDALGQAELQQLVTEGKLSAVENDYLAVMSMGSTLQDLVWQPLASHFLEQVGSAALAPGGAGQPRLALLDTSPTREVDAARQYASSLHGYTLANMAESLLCSGTCLAQVTTRLTLSFTDYHRQSRQLSGRNKPEGGYLGSLGELAESVRGEVEDWQLATPNDPLVLNLSLAWHPIFSGLQADVEDMSLAVQAIYAALADANCRGALVIAAAGNQGGGPGTETGPLLPAAWENRRAPGPSECAARLGTAVNPNHFPPAGRPVYRPFVYATGGVRSNGEALGNSRPGGEPRLAAYADHAVVTNVDGTGGTSILTGSSVASLVISATAAAVWHYRPSLAAHELMDLLYDSGDNLARTAEFCLGGSSTNPCPQSALTVHRISFCNAVLSACSSSVEYCPAPADLPICTTWSTAGPDLSGVDMSSFTDSTFPGITLDLQNDITTPSSTPPICQGETLHLDPTATAPTDPCPHRQYHGMSIEPWTGPQPSSDPCPPCWAGNPPSEKSHLAAGGVLYIEIDDELEGQLTDATLVIGSDTYNLNLGTLEPGDTIRIDNLPTIPNGVEVSLTFTLDGDRSVSSSVLVVD